MQKLQPSTFSLSVTQKTSKRQSGELEEAPVLTTLGTYMAYIILYLVGTLREFIWGTGPLNGNSGAFRECNRDGYAPLFSKFENFYVRNVFRRLRCMFFRPIVSVPGAKVSIMEIKSEDYNWSFAMEKDQVSEFINLGSYNYLGFAENKGPVTESAINSTKAEGLTNCSPRHELGSLQIHRELEDTVAEFLGTDDAITVGMGFATNTLNMPILWCKGTLVLSDEKNHASLILGLRLSGAVVKVFKHNNIDNLEYVLRKSIINGHPKTRRPWRKIIIVVEGVYSMEGTIVKLPQIVKLKKKYGAYIYLDEAHSVGAMGPRGRGVVDYYGLSPKDIDIMMGTFTKSFGAAGGYIAGSRQLINYLRVHSQSYIYPPSISPPVARQIISSMREIMQGNGLQRIKKLARNSRYFRQRLQELGCVVYGHDDSPVVPMMLFSPVKVNQIVLNLHSRKIATVGVGFPATNMTEERTRFCLSTGHTKEMIDAFMDILAEEVVKCNVPLSRKRISAKKIVY